MQVVMNSLDVYKYVVYQTKKTSGVLMSSFASWKLYHMCEHMGLKGGTGRRAWGQQLVGNVQLILSMGPEWREVSTLALKATNPSKGF